MGTRSRIGMEVLGQIKSVYVHRDGYLEGVGLTLLKHYSDDAKAAELVAAALES